LFRRANLSVYAAARIKAVALDPNSKEKSAHAICITVLVKLDRKIVVLAAKRS